MCPNEFLILSPITTRIYYSSVSFKNIFPRQRSRRQGGNNMLVCLTMLLNIRNTVSLVSASLRYLTSPRIHLLWIWTLGCLAVTTNQCNFDDVSCPGTVLPESYWLLALFIAIPAKLVHNIYRIKLDQIDFIDSKLSNARVAFYEYRL